jgi:hypothetical protein
MVTEFCSGLYKIKSACMDISKEWQSRNGPNKCWNGWKKGRQRFRWIKRILDALAETEVGGGQ